MKNVLGDAGKHSVAPDHLGGQGEAEQTDHQPTHEPLRVFQPR
jgi:hypothetical protein